MKTYKVIALSVSGKGKKIFESGDIVSEENFPEGNAEALVKTGHLKPVDEPVVKNPWGEGKQKPEAKETEVEANTAETEANTAETEADPFDLDNLLGKKKGKNKGK